MYIHIYIYIYVRSHFGSSLRASESHELQIPLYPDIMLRGCCVVQFCLAVFGVQRPTIENMGWQHQHGGWARWSGTGSTWARKGPWAACSCGGWTYDSRSISNCQLCGQKLNKKEWPTIGEWLPPARPGPGNVEPAEQSKLPPLSEEKHAALEAVLVAAGPQLDMDLRSMLIPLLPSRATPQQKESQAFKALAAARVAANKAKAVLSKADRACAALEEQLERARKVQGEAKDSMARSELELESAHQAYLAAPSDDGGLRAEGGGAAPEEGHGMDVDSEQCKKLQEELAQQEESIKATRKRLEEAKAAGAKRQKVAAEGASEPAGRPLLEEAAKAAADAAKATHEEADRAAAEAAKAPHFTAQG